MTFTCSCCGEVHEGLADLVFDAPHYYHTVPLEQRNERCLLTTDLCSIDNEDFFIRGCLDIPIIGRPERFSWGAWCSVSRANFDKYREVLELKVMAHLRDERTRPWFELEESEHPPRRSQTTHK